MVPPPQQWYHSTSGTPCPNTPPPLPQRHTFWHFSLKYRRSHCVVDTSVPPFLEHCRVWDRGGGEVKSMRNRHPERFWCAQLPSLATFCPVMLMDEISNGLDSATTFEICSTLKSIARCLKKTVVATALCAKFEHARAMWCPRSTRSTHNYAP